MTTTNAAAVKVVVRETTTVVVVVVVVDFVHGLALLLLLVKGVSVKPERIVVVGKAAA
eukprot:CAMPEP_0171807226 /NCGR_PEP_ID=MMETSP0991-20121206/75724_1 /TAXON_ID=483369 /ORGANISM="non described non described, Strain CCMP2098" /LENGTH=57 /DNA_ID=CAMNT_0012420037 /DNA_START=480 /DNA_END=649 /DNA_ORIENTATION=-